MARLSCIIDNAMDLVYICRSGENEELRYSIRSAVKNLKFDNLWIVGGKPSWYSGNYIKVDQTKNKYTNATNNLKALTQSEQISESFILMNDDFYILNKVSDVPYMHSKTLDDKIKARENLFSGNSYIKLLKQTLVSVSKKTNGPVLDYELHVPMIMEKKKLLHALKFRGLWRSIYGNLFEVGGIEITDVKVYAESSPFYSNSYKVDTLKYDYLSSNDDSFETVKEKVLEKRFPDKSAYEI
jgi:hypothetical protein